MTLPDDPPPDAAAADEFARTIPPLGKDGGVAPDEAPGGPETLKPTPDAPHADTSAAMDTSPAMDAPPAVPPAILALPLRASRLLPVSLDLLLRAETGLRAASFYIGFVLAGTVGPVVALVAAAAAVLGEGLFEEGQMLAQTWPAWLAPGMFVAVAGYFVASIEVSILAAAVIGATVEGRPLSIGGLLRLCRRRFWTASRAGLLIAVPAVIGQAVGSGVASALGDPSGQLAFAFQLIASVLFGVPFVYALAGVVIGEVGARESVRRSWRLFRARPRLALVVSAFGIVPQFVVLFALSAGADIVIRVIGAVGIEGEFPRILAVAASFVFTFALGTLTFLAAAIASTPQVHAFIALTHYTHGLELGRDPADAARGRRAWVTLPLAVAIAIALLSLAAGIASLPA